MKWLDIINEGRYNINGFPRQTLKAGTIIYHGTDAKVEFDIPSGPAWFAHTLETAKKWIGWASKSIPSHQHGVGRVLSFEVIRDVPLLDLGSVPESGEGWSKFCEMLTGQYDELGPLTVAHEMDRNLNGWVANTEIMLINPELFVRTIR